MFWHYRLQLSLVYETVSQISFNLFSSGDKRLLSELLRKWHWFNELNQHFPKYLEWKLKFQNTETHFCRWKSNDQKNINIFLSLENPCFFLLAEEKTWRRVFNTNNELSQNRTGKQFTPFKTTVNYWLFKWRMFFSHCLFWLKKCRFSTNSYEGLYP